MSFNIDPPLESDEALLAIHSNAAYALLGPNKEALYKEKLSRFAFFDKTLSKIKVIACDGTRIAALQDDTNQRIIFSYRGTDISEWKDLLDDLLILNGGKPLFFKSEANRFVESVLKKADSTYEIIHTGHSLGGTIAEIMAIETKTKAVVFNPGGTEKLKDFRRVPPVHPMVPLIQEFVRLFIIEEKNPDIIVHIIIGDPVSFFKETPGIVFMHKQLSISIPHSISNFLPVEEKKDKKRPREPLEGGDKAPPPKKIAFSTPSSSSSRPFSTPSSTPSSSSSRPSPTPSLSSSRPLSQPARITVEIVQALIPRCFTPAPPQRKIDSPLSLLTKVFFPRLF